MGDLVADLANAMAKATGHPVAFLPRAKLGPGGLT